MPGFEVIGAEEQAEINDIFARGGVLFRHGFDALRNDCYKVREFESAFASYMKVPHALAVTSGTAALRVALAALDLQPGDEVITQSFTFVATAEAIIEARAVPVCCEVDATLNMDPADLERRITPRTRAVIAVHMLGTPARLREITDICSRKNVVLIEDAAWGCGGSLDGRALGTWGRMGTYSFDFAKTMTTGEGGMIVFRDKRDYERAAAWHDHGHENNPAVPRWEDTRSGSGFNYRMNDAAQAHVFVGLSTKGPGESGRIARSFVKHGFGAIDLTHDELAQEHIRHMVGGISALAKDERVLRFVFPERPGALMKFLSLMRPGWNISLFHYRNQGADYGRIL
ncbi:MAG: aminotransferase class I/II-fold pyridoxal phosphate-dependent enzyme, partial [Acidimicrobiia bacterium]|nr:aminotransferase class I/II-fold pyridoxal phosphate-dependent enzyme [Acidimicrobiia bacterium]